MTFGDWRKGDGLHCIVGVVSRLGRVDMYNEP
jgi:hypothetical protein